MEIITYTTIWFALAGLFSILLLSANPYYKKEFSKVTNKLGIAYEIALQKAEQIEISKHKWLESEKAVVKPKTKTAIYRGVTYDPTEIKKAVPTIKRGMYRGSAWEA